MTVQEALEILKTLVPKTCKMVNGRRKGGFDDWESDTGKAIKMAIESMNEVEQYRALGTVEELKEAREKQVASKWIECPYADLIMCPSCNAEFSTIDNCTEQFEYCPKCGKRLG